MQFCILFFEGNWAHKTNLFASIMNLESKNAILSKGIFLANCVKRANFLIIWCPYWSRVGEPLSLCILKTTNLELCVKQNVPTYDALSTKNFCSKSNTLWDISSQSFQIGSGTPCTCISLSIQKSTWIWWMIMFVRYTCLSTSDLGNITNNCQWIIIYSVHKSSYYVLSNH